MGIEQPKYKEAKTFEKMLELSQGFVDEITNIFIKDGWITQKYNDEEPLVFPNGIEIRGLDLLIAKKGKSFFVDAKDFGKLVYIMPFGTGLPINLVNRYKKLKQELGRNCYLFFRDNPEVEEKYPSPFKDKITGKYLPYGGEIDSFKEHPRSKDPTILCSWTGEIQIIWRLDSMKTIWECLEDLKQANFFKT